MNQFDKLNHICPAGSGGEGNQTRFELDNTHGLTVDYSCASCCDQATFDTIYDQHDGDWNIACNEAGGISTGELTSQKQGVFSSTWILYAYYHLTVFA